MKINYISKPTPVNVGEVYFDIAHKNHFWIHQRFSVCRQLVDLACFRRLNIAEVGCGSGVLLNQFSDFLDTDIHGFDLSEHALKMATTSDSRNQYNYYNIHDRDVSLKEKFDLIILFDVIEHIELPTEFLQSVGFHLRESGSILLNVPAVPLLYSKYDRVNGHVRRYDHAELDKQIKGANLLITRWSYWGIWYMPLLALRKLFSYFIIEDRMLNVGFSPPSRLINSFLKIIGKLEFVPQHLGGTSIMALIEKPKNR